jgi:hypothetical protein
MRLRRGYQLVSAVVASVAVVAVVIAARGGSAAPPQGSIYWGAYVEGHSTYSTLFGGTWGDAPWDPKTVARFERDAGKRMSIEHYGQPPPWEQAFDGDAAQRAVQHGAVPAIDMSTRSVPLAQLAAGRYDESIETWAKAARAFGHPFFLLFDEEMNGNWYPWSPGENGNTAADFVAAWRHVHDVMDAAGATNVTWVWCPNVDPDHRFTPYAEIYPGDAYVDWTCLNGYNWGRRQWLGFDKIFGSSYRDLLRLAPQKPIMIGELGSDERGGSKSAWITDALARELPERFPRVAALLWFNWRINEDDVWWPWEIESSPSSLEAFKRAIASPYYAPGGDAGSLPALTRVQPLS